MAATVFAALAYRNCLIGTLYLEREEVALWLELFRFTRCESRPA